jgi:hypothetical protein
LFICRPYRKRDTELYFKVFAKWKQICPAVRANTNAWVFNGNNVIYSTQSIARIQDIEGIVIPVDEHVGSLFLYFKNCNSFH